MLSKYGFEGEIREFSLYDSERERDREFVAYAEYLTESVIQGTTKTITGWISQCRYCNCLRCVLINEDRSWECMKCGKKGSRKPEEKKKESMEKKRDPNRKKVLNCLLKERKKE